MSSRRGALLFATLCIAVALVLDVRGQTSGGVRRIVDAGLSAVDAGLMGDESHTPGSVETVKRARLANAISQDRVSASGIHYEAGRVIVKFRDQLAADVRLQAIRSASASGAVAPRASHADFDIVTLDSVEDPREVARLLEREP